MPLQNRVTPEGEIIATQHRGLLMGNRGGTLHTAQRTLGRRRWASRQWIACVLSFKGRRRQLMQPNRYTELFFLDEATALAAGHRPCFECRRADAQHFAQCWGAARGLEAPPSAPAMDRILHGERLDERGGKRSIEAPLPDLPDGTMIRLGPTTTIYLIDGQRLFPWSPAGYGPPEQRPRQGGAKVLTPTSIVAVLCAGYRPKLHPSALAGAD